MARWREKKNTSTASLLYKTIHSQQKRFSFTYVCRYVLVNVKITACKHVLSQLCRLSFRWPIVYVVRPRLGLLFTKLRQRLANTLS